MSSWFSCCTQTFSYHFHNFTFARSRETVHHENEDRLHTLHFPSFISFGSHRTHQVGHQPQKVAKRPGRRDSTALVEIPGHGTSPSIAISSPGQGPTQGPKFKLPRSGRSPDASPNQSPIIDPTRHVSFARDVSGRSSSERVVHYASRSIISATCLSSFSRGWAAPR